jgi:hypothetical protein
LGVSGNARPGAGKERLPLRSTPRVCHTAGQR